MESSAKLTLKLDGNFYPNFIKDKNYSNEALQAIKETVRKLLEQPTSVNRPGMLLGKVQSGKTKTFMGIMSLGFDNLQRFQRKILLCPKGWRPGFMS
jgi:hypothetical protein